MLGVVARVLLITVVPLSVGMWLRARRPTRVAEIEGTFRTVALVVFLAVVVGVIVAEHDRVFDNIDDVAAAAVTLNLAAMTISLLDRPNCTVGQPPVNRHSDRARDPQLDAGDRRRGDDRDGTDDPSRGLRQLHVRQCRPLRAADVQAKLSRHPGAGCEVAPGDRPGFKFRRDPVTPIG